MIAKSNALLKDSQILRMILFAYLYRLKMQIRFKKLFVYKTTKEDRKKHGCIDQNRNGWLHSSSA